MKRFTEINEDYSSDLVRIGSMKTTRSNLNYINSIISKYRDYIYKPFGYTSSVYDEDLDVNGVIINSQYISKMVNNYNIFISVSRISGITNFIDLMKFIEDNLYDIYHFNGKYFERTIDILITNTRKGNVGEKNARDYFTSYVKQNNKIDIVVTDPTVLEDRSGIDGKFTLNGKDYTIQVKPYSSYKIEDDLIYVVSKGAMKVNTNYLITYKGNNFLIFRNKGGNIRTNGNMFIMDKDTMVNKLPF